MPALSPAQLASIRESTGAVNGWEGSIRSGKTIAPHARGAVRYDPAARTEWLNILARRGA